MAALKATKKNREIFEKVAQLYGTRDADQIAQISTADRKVHAEMSGRILGGGRPRMEPDAEKEPPERRVKRDFSNKRNRRLRMTPAEVQAEMAAEVSALERLLAILESGKFKPPAQVQEIRRLRQRITRRMLMMNDRSRIERYLRDLEQQLPAAEDWQRRARLKRSIGLVEKRLAGLEKSGSQNSRG